MKIVSEISKEEADKIKILFSDFDGVFTNNFVYTSEDGKEFLRCSRLDGIGISLLRKTGIELIVVSSEENPTVEHRCKKLNIECFYGVRNKGSLIKKILKNKKLKSESAIFIGNDINDLSAHQFCKFKIAVPDSHPSYIEHCEYVTKAPGGHGAIREICDHMYKTILNP